MTWRVWWYIAGRWFEARAERLRRQLLIGTDTAAQWQALEARWLALRTRAEKCFARAGL